MFYMLRVMSQLRWKTAAGRVDGLFELGRTVPGRGEYRSLTFHEVESKRIINHVPSAAGLPFEYTINPYRGCSHRCSYCFARPTHEYLGFGIGDDFDSQIVVKLNAVELTKAETAPARWHGASIAMGTNTDPYQKAEGKYRLTRGIVQVLLERGNPLSILTKSTLALRDLNLFATRPDLVTVDFSIPTLDETVWRDTEPGTPHPRQRMDAVATFNAAGVPSGVLAAPLLPGISDAPEQVEEVLKAAAEAGARFASTMMLHVKPGLRRHWFDWLQRFHPDLVSHYEALYRDRSFIDREHRAGSNRWNARDRTSVDVSKGRQLRLDLQ
jgi:DNA repair photolyase